MKKFFKFIILTVSLVVLGAILSGCSYTNITLDYDKDNFSFNFSGKSGYSKLFYGDMTGSGYNESFNGNTYYMEDLEPVYSGPANGARDDFYQHMMETNLDGQKYQLGTLTVDASNFKNGKGDENVNLNVFSGFDIESIYSQDIGGMHAFTDLAEQWQNASSSEREYLREKWMAQYILTFNFTAPVTQVSGDSKWVTISGNKLTLDIGHMLQDGGGAYVFKSTQVKEASHAIKGYTDLDSNAWYADAVTAGLDYGLMSGYSTTKFRPNNTVTFGQMAKIMANFSQANLSKYSSGSRNWAEPAMKWALAKGLFLASDVCVTGSTTKINLDKLSVPMTREECIFSMSRLYAVSQLVEQSEADSYTGSIPDLDSIQKKYQQGIKFAYMFKITSGVDKNGTFKPTARTTRAQVCQMFYNLGWL